MLGIPARSEVDPYLDRCAHDASPDGGGSIANRFTDGQAYLASDVLGWLTSL